jgi:hypothetical protein
LISYTHQRILLVWGRRERERETEMKKVQTVCGLVAASGALLTGFALFGVVGMMVAVPVAYLLFDVCQ